MPNLCHDEGMTELTMNQLTTADGTTISWGTAGNASTSGGPAVMLVHGITESHASWGPVADRLASAHQVVMLDLRGHGASSDADRYDLEAMAGDVVEVAAAAGLVSPHLVGHSLGGAVVSAVGAVLDVSSVTNVDQSLQLGAFKEQVAGIEAMLRDPASFDLVISGLFDQLMGTKLPESERQRLTTTRRPSQGVVLGVWEMMFSMSSEDIAQVVEGALAGYEGSETPYLSIFGADPGEEYQPWLQSHIGASELELWDGYGHYPHLVDPAAFVDRLEAFWEQAR